MTSVYFRNLTGIALCTLVLGTGGTVSVVDSDRSQVPVRVPGARRRRR
jgi:hypothetical protein